MIIDSLCKFPNLEELVLSKNPFTKVPPRISKLAKVANLNLQDLNFEDFDETVKVLATMPSLKSLYINLQVEE